MLPHVDFVVLNSVNPRFGFNIHGNLSLPVHNTASRILDDVAPIYRITQIRSDKLFTILMVFTVICIEAIMGESSEYL